MRNFTYPVWLIWNNASAQASLNSGPLRGSSDSTTLLVRRATFNWRQKSLEALVVIELLWEFTRHFLYACICVWSIWIVRKNVKNEIKMSFLKRRCCSGATHHYSISSAVCRADGRDKEKSEELCWVYSDDLKALWELACQPMGKSYQANKTSGRDVWKLVYSQILWNIVDGAE